MHPSPAVSDARSQPNATAPVVARPQSQRHAADRVRWLAEIGVVGMLFVGLYFVSVRTETGQWLDNLGMYAATAPLPRPVTWSSRVVLRGTIPAALAAIALIIYRGRRVGGVFAAEVRRPMTLIVAAVAAAEVLKLVILPRPNLLNAGAWLTAPAFPSGHLTLTLAIGVAGIIVTADGACRQLTAAIAWLAGTLMATTLLVTHNHRISELAGSCLVVIAATLLVARRNRRTDWSGLAAGWPRLALGMLAAAGPFAGWGLSTAIDVSPAGSVPSAALLVGQALAAAGGCAIVIGIACSRFTRTVGPIHQDD